MLHLTGPGGPDSSPTPLKALIPDDAKLLQTKPGASTLTGPPAQGSAGNAKKDRLPWTVGNKIKDRPPWTVGNKIKDRPPWTVGNAKKDRPPWTAGNAKKDRPPWTVGNKFNDRPPRHDGDKPNVVVVAPPLINPVIPDTTQGLIPTPVPIAPAPTDATQGLIPTPVPIAPSTVDTTQSRTPVPVTPTPVPTPVPVAPSTADLTPAPTPTPVPVTPTPVPTPAPAAPSVSQSTPEVAPPGSQAVAPKANTLGGSVTMAGPEIRKRVADRAREEVLRRTEELKKDADKAGLCPGKAAATATSMNGSVLPTKDVLTALSLADPKVRAGLLVSVLDVPLSASWPPPNACCTDSQCTCGGSASDEAGCPYCAKGSILQYLKTHGYITTPGQELNFSKLYDSGDVNGLKNFLKQRKVPDSVANMLMGQRDMAQKFHQYTQDAKSGASTAQLAYDLGQFQASEQEYQHEVEAAGSAGLINPKAFADRLNTADLLSQKMEEINKYACVHDQSSMPWSPDPKGGWYVSGTDTGGSGSWISGSDQAPSDGTWYPWIPGPGGVGMNLSGAPLLIVNNPDLAAGITTQIGPDVVTIGTGGQGGFTVQVGSPTDLGYPPIISNFAPLPEAGAAAVGQYSGQAIVINPETTGVTLPFLVDQTEFSLPAGQALPLSGQPSWVIKFNRGPSLGDTSYTLAPGHYDFTANAEGWDLVQKTYKVVLDNSTNANDFSFVMEGQPGSIPAHQAGEISSKVPVVLTFDPGNGAEPANRELVEGSFTIGINPQSGLLDVFSVPSSASGPTSEAVPSAAPTAPVLP
jgi:hypothetical protein